MVVHAAALLAKPAALAPDGDDLAVVEQPVEATIITMALNRMTDLGMLITARPA